MSDSIKDIKQIDYNNCMTETYYTIRYCHLFKIKSIVFPNDVDLNRLTTFNILICNNTVWSIQMSLVIGISKIILTNDKQIIYLPSNLLHDNINAINAFPKFGILYHNIEFIIHSRDFINYDMRIDEYQLSDTHELTDYPYDNQLKKILNNMGHSIKYDNVHLIKKYESIVSNKMIIEYNLDNWIMLGHLFINHNELEHNKQMIRYDENDRPIYKNGTIPTYHQKYLYGIYIESTKQLTYLDFKINDKVYFNYGMQQLDNYLVKRSYDTIYQWNVLCDDALYESLGCRLPVEIIDKIYKLCDISCLYFVPTIENNGPIVLFDEQNMRLDFGKYNDTTNKIHFLSNKIMFIKGGMSYTIY